VVLLRPVYLQVCVSMKPTAVRVLIVLVCLGAVLASGCFHSGVRPRSAEVLSEGDVAAGVNFTITTIELGDVDLPGELGDVEGYTGWRAVLHPLMALGLHAINSQGYLRLGLDDGTELGLFLGAQEMGSEIRLAVLDEDAGDGASLAASAAAMWRPFMDLDFPWVRAGVDVSRRSGGVAPLGGVYATYGPETHALLVPERLSERCESFGQPGCGEYGPTRHFLYTRHELRLQGSVGLSVLFTETGHLANFPEPLRNPKEYSAENYIEFRTGHRLTFGVVPYVVLWSEQVDYQCVGCDLPEGDFNSDWGASLTIGYDYHPEHDPIID
jgi:hypothetical protein